MAKTGPKPRYRSEYATQGGKLCLMGYTDEMLADFFEIGIATLYRWKNRHPEFKEALRYNKAIDDAEVVSALRQRAIGYSHEDCHVSNYMGAITVTKLTKHYPPDTAAALFWLSNRQPHLFQKDPQQATSGDSAADALRELAERLPE
jgi:hypothetical protein